MNEINMKLYKLIDNILSLFSQVCFLNCIRLLLQHGANPNCSHHNLTPLHVLMFTVNECLTTSSCDVQKQNNFEFIKNILLLLLQHGFDCNKTYQDILQTVMDIVQNLRSCNDMLMIYELALIFIQHGANANIILSSKPTTSYCTDIISEITNFNERIQMNGTGFRSGTGGSFRAHSRYLLFYYIILITRKEFLLVDNSQTYTKVIYLFYFSMSHEPLFNCLKCLHNFYMAQIPNRCMENLISLIVKLYRKPRTLKQICRQAIYQNIQKNLSQNISKLNLPGPLRDYVLNFEP